MVTSLNSSALISGSLDIAILSELLDEGVRIFQIRLCMQKILLNGNIGVIGSQNFTTGGAFNLEASVLMSLSEKNKAEMNEIINEVFENSIVLTREVLEEFKSFFDKYEEQLSELHLALKKVDNFLQQKLEDKKEKLKNRKELTQDEIDNSIKSKVIRRKKGEKSVKTEPYQFQIRKIILSPEQ